MLGWRATHTHTCLSHHLYLFEKHIHLFVLTKRVQYSVSRVLGEGEWEKKENGKMKEKRQINKSISTYQCRQMPEHIFVSFYNISWFYFLRNFRLRFNCILFENTKLVMIFLFVCTCVCVRNKMSCSLYAVPFFFTSFSSSAIFHFNLFTYFRCCCCCFFVIYAPPRVFQRMSFLFIFVFAQRYESRDKPLLKHWNWLTTIENYWNVLSSV